MTYTNRLKLSIASHILFIIIVISLCFIKKPVSSTLIVILIFLAAVLFGASIYLESGECKKWRGLWDVPNWYLVIYILLAAALIALIFVLPETSWWTEAMVLLITLNHLILNLRYYRYAVRFKMDELDSVGQLISLYPEAEQLMNNRVRKNKGDA